MKKRITKIVSTVLIVMSLVVLCAISAYADNTGIESDTAAIPYNTAYTYTLRTIYGTYYIPSGTVVGYNNYISGYYVEGCQAALKHVNNYSKANCDPGDIDGLFGGATYNAIYNFQVWSYLTPDGYAGNDTFSALQYWCNEL